MFKKGNTESIKGGKKSFRSLVKKLGSKEEVSKHFRKLRLERKKKRLERLKSEK